MSLYVRALKNCYTDHHLWQLYMLELEKVGTDIEQIRTTYDQALAQIKQGDKLTDNTLYSLAKAMHDCYSRQIVQPAEGEEDALKEATAKLREFYEATSSQIAEVAKSPEYLLSWMLLHANVEASKICDIKELR